MGLSQRDQTKHNTLLRLGTQSVIIGVWRSYFWSAPSKFFEEILLPL